MRVLPELREFSQLAQAARGWFVPSSHEDWRWNDGGRVLEWRNGETLCFAEELKLIFERLEPRPPPYFRSIVYLLAACRGCVPDEETVLAAAAENVHPRLRAVLSSLTKISFLDPALIRSIEGRAELMDMVLNRSRTERRRTDASTLLAAWLDGAATSDVSHVDTRFDLRPLLDLADGLAAFSESALRLRVRTGLEELPGPAPLPEPDAESIRTLLEDLRDDPDLGGMARLAREIMAALRVPRALSTPDDLPVGGWADISNRGTPDRLLLTELAQDPLMLSVRVAQQEALYLRREPPAHHEDPPPAILIDTGLRLWGVPRVFAASVALALAASRENPDKKAALITCQVFRAAGGEIAPVSLHSREGLTDLLEHVEPVLDPLPALRVFARELEPPDKKAKTGPASREPFFITHPDSLEDAAFRSALRNELPAMYVATVNREGRFALHRSEPHRGVKLLSEAKVDLEQLFRPIQNPGAAAPRYPLLDRNAANLPDYFSLNPEPLLLPAKGSVQFSVQGANGRCVAVMDNRAVIAWTHGNGRGCVTLVKRLPPGKVRLLEILDSDGTAVVILNENRREQQPVLVIAQAGGWSSQPVATLPAWSEVTSSGETAFFLDNSGAFHARSLRSGEALGSLELPKINRLHASGIFEIWPAKQGDPSWARVAYDGQAIRRFLLPQLPDGLPWLHAWMHRPSGSLMALSWRGVFYSLSGEPATLLVNSPLPESNVMGAWPSRDGCLVLASSKGTTAILNCNFRSWRVLHEKCDSGAFTQTASVEPPRPALFIRVSAAGVSDDNALVLRLARSGAWIRLESTLDDLRWTRSDAAPHLRTVREFAEMAHDELELQSADWPGGRVILDRRGLLHLVPPGSSMPHLTLVLKDGATALWAGNGLLTGAPFCTGRDAANRQELTEAGGLIRQFCGLLNDPSA